MRDPDWQADLARYPRRPWLKEQSIWAIAVYRFGRRVDRRRPGLARALLERWYWLAFRVTETLTGISIPKSVEVGPGLKIWHFGNIFVHGDSVIGAHCTLRQGVTIGNREDDGPTPRSSSAVAGSCTPSTRSTTAWPTWSGTPRSARRSPAGATR